MMKRKVILCVCVAAAALFAIGSLVVRGTVKAPFYDKGAFALSKYQEEIEASPSDRNVGQIDDAETAVAKAKELWLEKYSADDRKRILERRFKEISERYADIIPSFDIINESASNYVVGKERLFEDYDAFSLELGGKYFKNNKNIINETNLAIWHNYTHNQGKYMAFNMQLKEFLRMGLPIDEIGLQYHIFEKEENFENNKTFLNAKYMMEILDIFDAYNLPMHISEVTVPCYSGRLIQNEEIQAELTEILYTTWFATRNMKSIVWWNLVDGYAAYAPLGSEQGENRYAAGLVHFDMTKKPSYNVLDRLINSEWKTNISDAVSGKEYSFKGFYGEYEIEVKTANGTKKHTVMLDGSKEITL